MKMYESKKKNENAQENDYHVKASITGSLLFVLQKHFKRFSKDTLLSFIFCGEIKVNGSIIKTHLHKVKRGDHLLILRKDSYVSRGAYKIVHPIEKWNIRVKDKIWLDCGAATGGFTDYLLSLGASAVHTVDIAYNALAYKLRIDKRVLVHEKTNIFSVNSLTPTVDSAVVDVSFRSLRNVLSHVLSLCKEGCALALCKPQFELAYTLRNNKKKTSQRSVDIDKNENSILTNAIHKLKNTTNGEEKFSGVIRNDIIRKNVILKTILSLLKEQVFTHAICPAGIHGRRGNQEFFLYVRNIIPQTLEKDLLHCSTSKNEICHSFYKELYDKSMHVNNL